MGYEKDALVLIISLYWKKKRYSREHAKNPNAYVWARTDVTFWAVGYHSPPPRVPASFSHILCKI